MIFKKDVKVTETNSDNSNDKPSSLNQSKSRQGFTLSGFAWSMLVIGGLVLAFLLFFITQNLENTTIKFLFWETISVPLGIALLISALAGSFLTIIIAFFRMWRIKRQSK